MVQGKVSARARRVVRPRDVTLEISRLDQQWRTVRTAVRGVCLVAVVWLAGNIVGPLAGENTALSLGVSFLGDLKVSLAFTLAASAAAWAVVERVLRQRKTQYLQDRVRELEARLDPHRSTSGLTPKGKTNPNDKRM